MGFGKGFRGLGPATKWEEMQRDMTWRERWATETASSSCPSSTPSSTTTTATTTRDQQKGSSHKKKEQQKHKQSNEIERENPKSENTKPAINEQHDNCCHPHEVVEKSVSTHSEEFKKEARTEDNVSSGYGFSICRKAPPSVGNESNSETKKKRKRGKKKTNKVLQNGFEAELQSDDQKPVDLSDTQNNLAISDMHKTTDSHDSFERQMGENQSDSEYQSDKEHADSVKPDDNEDRLLNLETKTSTETSEPKESNSESRVVKPHASFVLQQRMPNIELGDNACAHCGSMKHETKRCKFALRFLLKDSEKHECLYCGSEDHNLQQCTKRQQDIERGQYSKILPYAVCIRCKQPGHLEFNCPDKQRIALETGCKKCGSMDHVEAVCDANKKRLIQFQTSAVSVSADAEDFSFMANARKRKNHNNKFSTLITSTASHVNTGTKKPKVVMF